MEEKELKPKRLAINATFFLIGGIATIVLTKFGDRLLPNDTTVVKQLADTIRIVHEYRLPDREQIAQSKSAIKNEKKQVENLKEDLNYLNDLREERRLVDSTIRSLQAEISETNTVIFKESYNQIIDDKIFPSRKGLTYKYGQSSNFEFVCPTDRTSDYIDLRVIFHDTKMVQKIGCLLISINGLNNKNNKKSFYHIFEQAYEVKEGLNIIRIRNYLKEDNGEFSIGYILKTELNKEYPYFEKVTCKF